MSRSRLEQEGAKHTGTAKFQPWVVVDGRLVTGQNLASAAGVAQKVVDAHNAASAVITS